jgi:HK97 family phage major capsid protein
MDPELKALMEKLEKEWAQFRSENDRRLKEIEAKGKADPLTEEKIEKHSKAVGELQKQMDELAKKMNRPGATAEDEAAGAAKAHRKAYGTYLRKGLRQTEHGDLADLQVKALSVGVEADGGYAVPEELDRNIGQIERNATPMESLVTSITVGAETYEKLFSLGGAASGWVGETDVRPDTATPTMASVKPFYGELYAKPKATQKMLDDAFFDAEAWLADEVGLKFAADLDAAIVSGNGTARPKGFLSYTINSTADASRAFGAVQYVPSGAAAALTDTALIDVIQTLKPMYRQNGRWVMGGLTVAAVRKFKDATSGQYLWQPGLQAGQPSQLLGYPLTEDENMPAVSAGNYSIAFADWRRAYKIANVRGVRVLRDPYTDKPYVVFYTTKRVGGGLEDSLAIKLMKIGTT